MLSNIINQKSIYLFILFFILIFLPSLLPIADSLADKNTEFTSLEQKSKLYSFIMSVIIGPLFETLIYQLLIIEVTQLIIKNNRIAFIISILISTFAFALGHTYTFYYFILALYVGALLAIAYYVAREKKNNPLFFVFALHSINNLIAYILH